MTVFAAGPKIAVVGNCQARPLRAYLGDMLQQAMPIEPIIVHLATDEHRDDHLALLDTSDVILAQPVAANYPASHLRTAFLRERYADKLVVWPNLFFHGQTPSLFYVTASPNDGGPVARLRSALDVYHDEFILECWLEGLTTDACVDAFHQADTNAASRMATSLGEFRTRESECDVHMADFISDRFRAERLFFTFNHPTAAVLCELTERVGRHLDLPFRPELARSGEFLGRVVPPTSRAIREELRLTFPEVRYVGVVSSGAEEHRYEMDLHEVTRASYEAYDAQLSRSETLDLRFTPPKQ